MLKVNFFSAKSLVISKPGSSFAVLVDRKGIRDLSQDKYKRHVNQTDFNNTRASLVANLGQVLVFTPTLGCKFLPAHYNNSFRLIDLENEKTEELSTQEAQKLWQERFRNATICDIPRFLIGPITCYVNN